MALPGTCLAAARAAEAYDRVITVLRTDFKGRTITIAVGKSPMAFGVFASDATCKAAPSAALTADQGVQRLHSQLSSGPYDGSFRGGSQTLV